MRDKQQGAVSNKYNPLVIESIKGGMVMQEIKIKNYITVEGKTVLWSEISERERKEFSNKLQENFMRIAGYKRRTA